VSREQGTPVELWGGVPAVAGSCAAQLVSWQLQMRLRKLPPGTAGSNCRAFEPACRPQKPRTRCPALPCTPTSPPIRLPASCRPCSAIYKYALDHLPKSQAGELYRRFVQFEKQQGDREGIEVR